ncbi:hypothetical protein EFE41_04005 [Methanohalophilus portucalensis FDF-1]|uniref:Thioredoxin domain-containing protein n=1 Tax=Methanohalophilus portucalensis FDF-1 TaxID=523843 RepID=A0A3M9LFW6_9EURY|nr:hypothetical protein EFE41_04005 [Methanohalophilus portucalensis FDF-1]
MATCPHCRAIEPHFKEYSKHYGNPINFVMVNPKVNPGIVKNIIFGVLPHFSTFAIKIS